MPIRRIVTLLVLIGALLAACVPATGGEPGTSVPVCGDDVCADSEDTRNCPADCSQAVLSGKTMVTSINSEASGEVAVLIAYPLEPRFPDGAGVVVVVPSFLEQLDRFTTEPDFTSIGLIQVTFLWPGQSDERYGVSSEGDFDYGGEASIQVLRDVIRFATGRLLDENNRSLTTLIPVKPMAAEVGLYARGDAGMAAVNALALYGDVLGGVAYFVGDENPTVDTLLCLEAGHFDEDGLAIYNPFYQFSTGYTPAEIVLNYGTLRWDAETIDPDNGFSGLPYLDLNGDDRLDESDHVFDGAVPVMFGKRYYSTALTQALLDNSALPADTWSPTLATAGDAKTAWDLRQSTGRYLDLALMTPDLKVMLLFARRDQAQVADDKPHIHQAFQGFRFEALLRWVRLNPDRTYMQWMSASLDLDFPDNPANTQPEDWLEIVDWAYAGGGPSGGMAPLAALAEMADRAHTGRWDENLGDVLYEFLPATPEP